jgi:hypothetical protein
MGSRERKRAERQKRKRRSLDREPGEAAPVEAAAEAAAEGNGDAPAPVTFKEKMERRYEESERRNAERRAQLEPLEQGERPTAVTVGAIISGVLAVIFTVSAIVAVFSSAEIDGNEPQPLPLAAFGSALWLMAWGMWKARYWAVLGFQMLLVLFLIAGTAGIIAAETWVQVVATLLILGGGATLFYFMIRAMARIQMPEPREPDL